jgi:methyl-accepting chemotaxis protein
MNGTIFIFCIGSFLLLAVLAFFFFVFVGTTGFVAYKGTKAVASGVSNKARSAADEIHGIAVIPGEIRKQLKETRRYAKLIKGATEQCLPDQQKHLSSTLLTVDKFMSNLDLLEGNLRQLYSKRNPNKELQETVTELNDLREQLSGSFGKESQIINDLIKRKEEHLAILNDIRDFHNQLELKIRQNATIMNSTYAEITLLSGQGALDNKKIRQLNENLQENSDRLIDVLHAMEEVDEQSYLVA